MKNSDKKPTNQIKAPAPSKSVEPQILKWYKSKLVIIVLALFAMVIGVAVFTSPHHTTKQPASSESEKPESGKQTEEELRNYKQQVTVYVTSKGISPQTLNITKDTRINWQNKDSKAHKLAITPGTTTPLEFDNNHEIIPAGGYPYVLHQPVVFHYYVVDKPTHSATVIVK